MGDDVTMDDREAMILAIEQASAVRTLTSPNPWVGAAIVSSDGRLASVGATEPPGGAHAEVVALRAAGQAARGGTLVVTLEPCSHQGRTPPCVGSIVAADISRVVIAVPDPDHRVSGSGVAALRAAGVTVEVGLLADQVTAQLRPYLWHRRSGRPYVVCKLAATLDGGIAAADGSSQWITGQAARTDAHLLRAQSDAVVVGAGTVRADDPSLTVRHVDGRDPLRVVLGQAPPGARVHPCLEWSSDIDSLLDELGRRDVVQVMVEGGSAVVRSFHDLDLVDLYVVYVAPALFGGRDLVPMLAGPSAASVEAVWRGQFINMRAVGEDIRLDVIPNSRREADSGDPISDA